MSGIAILQAVTSLAAVLAFGVVAVLALIGAVLGVFSFVLWIRDQRSNSSKPQGEGVAAVDLNACHEVYPRSAERDSTISCAKVGPHEKHTSAANDLTWWRADFTDEELAALKLLGALGIRGRDGEVWLVPAPEDASGRAPECEPACRHRCPECRMGLGAHLTCDPRCEVRG